MCHQPQSAAHLKSKSLVPWREFTEARKTAAVFSAPLLTSSIYSLHYKYEYSISYDERNNKQDICYCHSALM